MADPIVEDLALDISPALDSIGSIDDALAAVVANFSSGITDALGAASGLTPTIDVGPITEDVNAALADALDAPRSVPVDADTDQAAERIAELAATPIEIPVTADTTPAQESIDDLSASASDASGNVDSLTGGVEALKGAAGLAKGEVGELGGFVSNIGPKAASAVSALTAVGAVVGVAVAKSADAEAQNKRFADTFGDLAAKVRAVNVGGLTIDLDKLAQRSGTANADLEATASRIGQLGRSGNASDAAIVSTTQNILALGATAAVTNPRLGDASDVADKLSAAFLRGGRALVPYGISLTKTQIEQEALRQTGKAHAADLTTFERITAGATLATAQFGDTLGDKFNKGAEGAQVSLRAVKTEIEETLVAVGQPLAAPFVEVLRGAAPVAEQLAVDIGALARVALPFLNALAPALAPVGGVLKLVGDGLDVIAEVADNVPAPILAIGAAVALVALQFSAAAPEAIAFGAAIDFATGPIGITLGALTLLGAAVDIFGTHEKAASTLAKDLDSALFGQVKTTGDLSSAVATLNVDLDTFIASGDQLQKDAPKVADALREQGRTADELRKSIQGSPEQFAAFRASLEGVDGASGALIEKYKNLNDNGLKVRLIAGQITEGQANQIRAHRELAKELDELRKKYEGSVTGQLAFLVSSGDITQAQLVAIEATHKNADGTINYTATLRAATAAAQSHADAEAFAAIAAAQHSGALDTLRAGLLNGTISATEAETQAVQDLGLSADDAKNFVKGVTDAVSQLVDSIVGKLPTAGSAVDDFSSGIKTAFGDVVSALGSNGGVDSAARALDSANQRLHDVETRAVGTTKSDAASHVQAIKDARIAVSRAEHDVAVAKSKDADELAKAQKKLEEAADPNKFIADLFRSAGDSEKFLKNLEKLSAEGFNALAVTLAQQGPEAAGALADKLAGNEAQAKFANAGVTAAGKVSSEFTGFIKQHLAPSILGPSTAVGDTLGTGITLGLSTHANSGPAKQQAAAAGNVLGLSFAAGFSAGAFGNVVSAAAGAAGTRLVANTGPGTSTFRRVNEADTGSTSTAGTHQAGVRDVHFHEKIDPQHVISVLGQNRRG